MQFLPIINFTHQFGLCWQIRIYNFPFLYFYFSDRMTSFIRNQEANGYHARRGSSAKSSENNTVVASVINEASRRGNDQEFKILFSKEPDEICLAELSEGNGIIVAPKTKKRTKQS